MKSIEIKEVENGYIVTSVGNVKHNGDHVYKNMEELKMLEDIGEKLLEFKVRVVRV